MDEDAEGAAEVFGMGQGLELARALGVEGREPALGHGLLQDSREKPGLGAQGFGLQAGGFAGLLDGGEIDVRGEVLFAGMGEQIVRDMVAMIGPQGAVEARGRNHFLRRIAIVDGQ